MMIRIMITSKTILLLEISSISKGGCVCQAGELTRCVSMGALPYDRGGDARRLA